MKEKEDCEDIGVTAERVIGNSSTSLKFVFQKAREQTVEKGGEDGCDLLLPESSDEEVMKLVNPRIVDPTRREKKDITSDGTPIFPMEVVFDVDFADLGSMTAPSLTDVLTRCLVLPRLGVFEIRLPFLFNNLDGEEEFLLDNDEVTDTDDERESAGKDRNDDVDMDVLVGGGR